MSNEISTNTPLAALTVGQFLEVVKDQLKVEESISEPVKHTLPEVMTKRQVSEYSGYAYNTINQYVSEGKIPYFRASHGGRKILFRRKEIDQWLFSNKVETIEEYKSNFDIKNHGHK